MLALRASLGALYMHNINIIISSSSSSIYSATVRVEPSLF